MNESQFVRANNRAFIINVLINAAAISLVLVGGFRDGFATREAIQIVFLIIGMGMGIGGYVAHKGEKLGAILIMGGSSVVYVACMLAQMNMLYLGMGYPVLFSAFVYMNE